MLLKRVSKSFKTNRVSYNQQFSDNYHIYHLIQKGEWRDHIMDDDVTLQEIQDCLYLNYGLNRKVSSNIVCTYHTWVPNRDTQDGVKTSKKIIVRIDDDNNDKILDGKKIRSEENGVLRPITFNDITLHVCIPWNTCVERDVNCDSQFMIDCIDEISASIQNAYHFIPETEKIYLFMDNAGGHGSNEAKDGYEKRLIEKFLMLVHYQ
jgi:hypothetical protein